jgi:hypothetical protein
MEINKTCVATCESCGSFTIYSVISFNNLDDLKEKLKGERYNSVGLIEFGHFDDYGNRIRSGIKIDNIEMTHIKWCMEANRYLELHRH